MENARNDGHVSWSFHHRFVQKYLRDTLLHIFNVGSCHCKTYSAQSENKLNFRHRHNISVGYVGRLWERSHPHSSHFRVKLRPNLLILTWMHMFLQNVSIHPQYQAATLGWLQSEQSAPGKLTQIIFSLHWVKPLLPKCTEGLQTVFHLSQSRGTAPSLFHSFPLFQNLLYPFF
jgi:hypothetical protein